MLFELEDGRQRAAMDEAEAQLAHARSQLADLQLGKRPEEIAQLEANLAEAKAALSYAQLDLERQIKSGTPRRGGRIPPRPGAIGRRRGRGPGGGDDGRGSPRPSCRRVAT